MGLELYESDRTLMILRDSMYGGSWTKMDDDLRDRLDDQKPFNYRLDRQIKADLLRIRSLEHLEGILEGTITLIDEDWVMISGKESAAIPYEIIGKERPVKDWKQNAA